MEHLTLLLPKILDNVENVGYHVNCLSVLGNGATAPYIYCFNYFTAVEQDTEVSNR